MMKNIFDDMPKQGTIIGMATEEEIKKHRKLNIKDVSIYRLRHSPSITINTNDYEAMLKHFEDFERERSEFWYPIYERLNVPWAWILEIDDAKGYIYVDREEDEDEEEK